MSDEQHDAIIIGSGHNSLVCALYLLRAGWSVRILERADIPGGAVKTLELTEPGFRHDWAAMNISNFRNSGHFLRADKNGSGSAHCAVTAAIRLCLPRCPPG